MKENLNLIILLIMLCLGIAVIAIHYRRNPKVTIKQAKILVIQAAIGLILQMEQAYANMDNAQRVKFKSVVSALYKKLPLPILLIISEQQILDWVQEAYDLIKNTTLKELRGELAKEQQCLNNNL